jgi:WD40 repeat protein
VIDTAFSPAGDLVALSQEEQNQRVHRLRIYNTRDLSLHREIPLRHLAGSIAFSRDGKTIAAGGADRQVQSMSVSTGEIEGPPLLLETPACFVRYARDNLLVTGGDKGHVQLWDALTGKRIGPAFEHHADILTCEVQPQGEALLTGTSAHMAMAWRFPVAAPGSLDALRLWVETTTGLEMKGRDSFVPLTASLLQEKRRQVVAP